MHMSDESCNQQKKVSEAILVVVVIIVEVVLVAVIIPVIVHVRPLGVAVIHKIGKVSIQV